MDKQNRALKLAANFSYITNKLNYCGPKEAYKELRNLLKNEEYNEKNIKEHFEKYEGLYVYLEKLADKHNKDPFDYEVIESYWLGNELLDSFSKADMEEIIDKLVKRGLPAMYADKLKNKLPKGMKPHHSFNVLFVGVGMTSGSVPTNIITMNNCIVSIGEVVKINDGITVKKKPLVIKSGKLEYGNEKKEKIKNEFLSLKKGDKVAIHWNCACKKLTDMEEKNVRKYTKQNMSILNQAGFFSTD